MTKTEEPSGDDFSAQEREAKIFHALGLNWDAATIEQAIERATELRARRP